MFLCLESNVSGSGVWRKCDAGSDRPYVVDVVYWRMPATCVAEVVCVADVGVHVWGKWMPMYGGSFTCGRTERNGIEFRYL